VGFDCYAPWATGCRGHSMDDLLARFRSRISTSQRMIAVPPAYHGDWNELPTEWDIVTSINYWRAEVNKDPSYVLVMPFRWATVRDGGLNQVKDRLEQFADDLLNPGTTSVYARFQDASSYAAGGEPFLAFDQDWSGSMWNSGGYAPAWVEASFGGSTRIKHITLRAAQNPAGSTVHKVAGLNLNGTWTTLATLSGPTQDGQVLSWNGSADVRAVRITTTQSPSWVAWHDIQFSR
jgi:hypothetical protein